MHPLTAGDLVRLLRELEQKAAPGELPVVRIKHTDSVDWASFPQQPTCMAPGLPVGQMADVRFAIANSQQGLHVQPFAKGYVDAHLDGKDVCQRAVAHLVEDTRVIEGAFVGALLGLVATAVTRNGGASALVALGAGVGAAAGANSARRASVVFNLQDLIAASMRSPVSQREQLRSPLSTSVECFVETHSVY